MLLSGTDYKYASERFDALISQVSRKNIEKLVQWMKTSTDFFMSPASTIYHSNYDGGLLIHTIKMTDIALHNFELYKEHNPDTKLTTENVIISCLFHDLCKIKNYEKTEKWTKNSNNQWVSYTGYEYIDTFPYGHGEKSVLFAGNFISLTRDEMLAIKHHMGPFEGYLPGTISHKTLYAAFEASPLCIIVHTADALASFAFESRIDLKAQAQK